MTYQNVSIKEFADALIRQLSIHGFCYSYEELTISGVLEDYEIRHFDSFIKKKNMAAIIHRVLLLILNEKDNNDFLSANRFKDLYDCHVCVIHIAQVYAKGIIEGRTESVFGLDDLVSVSEMERILLKTFEKNRRVPREPINYDISYINDSNNLLYDSGSLLIDVRNKEIHDKENRFENSVCIPIEDIKINPAIIMQKLNEYGKRRAVLYCSRGYMSSMAADILIKNGYSEIYVLSDGLK